MASEIEQGTKYIPEMSQNEIDETRESIKSSSLKVIEENIERMKKSWKNRPQTMEYFDEIANLFGKRQKEIKEQKQSLNKLKNNIQQLEKANENKNQSIDELERQLNKLNSTKDKLEKNTEDQSQEISKLKDEIAALRGQNKELQDQLSDSDGYTASQNTLLSSVLLETIANRINNSKAGIKLRNLAMSLGISTSVCLDHVRTMEKKGDVEIKYSSDDDSNPLIMTTN